MYLHAGHLSYRRAMPAQQSPLGRPEDARAQLRDFVRALHHAYLAGARLLAPGERAALPLLASAPLTVVVAAARHLHLIGTSDPLPTPAGPEVAEPDEIDGLTLMKGTDRLSQYLLDHSEPDDSGRTVVELEAPKQVIASRIGVKPETLSRLLHKLAERGCIEMEGSRLFIKDADALLDSSG